MRTAGVPEKILIDDPPNKAWGVIVCSVVPNDGFITENESERMGKESVVA
jgi:hypothetical protein